MGRRSVQGQEARRHRVVHDEAECAVRADASVQRALPEYVGALSAHGELRCAPDAGVLQAHWSPEEAEALGRGVRCFGYARRVPRGGGWPRIQGQQRSDVRHGIPNLSGGVLPRTSGGTQGRSAPVHQDSERGEQRSLHGGQGDAGAAEAGLRDPPGQPDLRRPAVQGHPHLRASVGCQAHDACAVFPACRAGVLHVQVRGGAGKYVGTLQPVSGPGIPYDCSGYGGSRGAQPGAGGEHHAQVVVARVVHLHADGVRAGPQRDSRGRHVRRGDAGYLPAGPAGRDTGPTTIPSHR